MILDNHLQNYRWQRWVIKNHAQDFCQILEKCDIAIENLLPEVSNKPLLIEGLHKHEGLIGTLLGFGRENAWLFHKKWSLKENTSLSGFWDSEEIETYERLHDWFSFFKKDSNDISSELFCPAFVVDRNSEETKNLKKSYLLMREKILQYYEGKDFLEASLSILATKSTSSL